MLSVVPEMSQMTNGQQDRIAAYRRRRAPDSQSDSQTRPWGDIAGSARPLESHAPTSGPSNSTRGAFASAMRSPDTPPQQQHQQQQNLTREQAMAHALSAASREASHPPTAKRSDSHQYHDMDIRSYIFDLELQNRELRRQLETARTETALPSSAMLVGGSDEAKREFLTNVLTQVESIVEAHRNKANAEIHRYKTEAEQAKNALEQLRQVIQTEGLDLTLAPAMIQFHRKQKRAAASGGGIEPSPLGIDFPKEVDDMLHQVAVDILTKLQAVTDRNQLGSTMREACRSGFQFIVMHFTDELITATKRQDAAIETLRQELDDAKKENRTMLLAHETKRVEMATEHQLELDALRDEIRTLTASTAGSDTLTYAMHEKAFAEYAQLLVEARREAANLRAELDQEKTKSAEVCLRLKANLEKRRTEFEQEIVAKAEEVVTQRDRLISELESRLRQREAQFARNEARDCGVQAGEPLVNMPDKENFVPQLLSVYHRDSRATAQNNEIFEREVWKKTQELLSKYGNPRPN
jgi:hypothetical protein